MARCAEAARPESLKRVDGRRSRNLRPVRATMGYITHAEGSALFELGNTRVVCTASVEDRVPDFLRDTGQGWLTAEYGMLPRATDTRGRREASRGRLSGRTQEIQRLIGRSLRAVTDLNLLGPRTVWIDCDVIQADGGTRTAAITGAYLALAQATAWLEQSGCIDSNPLRDAVAAVSVGVVGDRVLLDLTYEEDSRAEVDMNFVMTGGGRLVEVQGTAEKKPFTKAQLDRMAAVAWDGIRALIRFQRELLSESA